jgi:serine/threonine protein kinase
MDHNALSLARFEFGKILTNNGSYGRLYLARDRTTHFLVTLKFIGRKEIQNDFGSKNLSREMEIQCELQRDNNHIQKLYQYFRADPHLVLILEYVHPGTSMREVLTEAGRFNAAKSVGIVSQLAAVVDYCHSQSVIHRDIRPESILLGPNDTVKLTNFGLSSRFQTISGDYCYTICGTGPYMAPELVLKLSYNQKVDTWAVGAVLYEMLVGRQPFLSAAKVVEQQCIVNADYDGCTEVVVDPEAQDLMAQLLQKDPQERIELGQVGHHAWIQQVENDGHFV